MPAVTVEALAEHRRRTVEERLAMGETWPARWASMVLVSESGTPIDPSNVRRIVDRIGVEAGIDVLTPYDLRHTATSLISASGISSERLADLLGHRDTRMVAHHYRHQVTSSVDVAAQYGSQGAI